MMGRRDAAEVLAAWGVIAGAVIVLRMLIVPMIAGLFDRRR